MADARCSPGYCPRSPWSRAGLRRAASPSRPFASSGAGWSSAPEAAVGMTISPETLLGDIPLRRMGLGTNRLTNTPENAAFLREAVEAGINMVDTAHVYKRGESEAAIGSALSPV